MNLPFRIPLRIFFFLLVVSLHLQGLFFSFSQSTHAAQPHPNHLILIKSKNAKISRNSVGLIKNLRYHEYSTYTRLVLDLQSPTKFSETQYENPKHVRIQLSRAILGKTAAKKLKAKSFPDGVDITQTNRNTVTVVIDLERRTDYKLQTLPRPHRLVLDLFKAPAPSTSPVKETREPSSTKPVILATPPESPLAKSPKDILVILDPGHGGKDPGAIGSRGTKEKHITLLIAKKLRKMISEQLGAKVLLTREKDEFLELEERVELANKKKADIFISIHVNSHPQKSIKGIELYHFGKASDPRALEVAARENGTPLESNAPDWQFILADKLIDQKIDESRDFAWTTREALVALLKTHYKIKDHGVKTAPFYVLRFTTMPGILAEVAFVSNPTEEKRLRTSTYQTRMAEGIFEGIKAYIKQSSFLTVS